MPFSFPEKLPENAKDNINRINAYCGDPTFGRITQGGSSYSCVGQIVYGPYFCPELGNGVAIRVWLDISASSNKVKCCLYNACWNKVTNGETEEKTNLATGTAQRAFNFLSSPSLTAQTYHLAVWADNTGSGDVRVCYDNSGFGSHLMVDTERTYGTWPPTLDVDNDWSNYDVSICCDYTSTGLAYTRTWVTDSLFKKLGITQTFAVDMALQEQDIPEAFDIDVSFLETIYVQRQTDVLFKRLDILKAFVVDVDFLKGDVIKGFAVDARFGAVGAVAYTRGLALDVVFAHKVRLPEIWLDEEGKIVFNISRPYVWVRG